LKLKLFIAAALIFAGLAGLCLFWLMPAQHKYPAPKLGPKPGQERPHKPGPKLKPTPGKLHPEGPELVRLQWSQLHLPAAIQDRKLVMAALSRSLSIARAAKNNAGLLICGNPVSRKAMVTSLERLKEIISIKGSQAAMLHSIQNEFIPYEIKRRNNSKNKPLLVTGYFQPSFRGSTRATPEFSWPVYARPRDLITVNLRRFSQKLPAETLWGRVENQQLVPYYSRKDIETGQHLDGSLALCWLNSPVDVLELQIQGSGIIHLDDGTSRFIHYAASNGLEYKSIGKVLRKRGLLPLERLDWPGIRQWAESHPARFQEILRENPRYIFFRWEKTGPIGSYGQVLVPGTSVALDSKVYPPGMPGLLLMDWPKLTGHGPPWFKNRPSMLMVFNHDKGNAIKSPFRLDLYCGDGKEAGRIAGKLKNPARLIILIHKDFPLAP